MKSNLRRSALYVPGDSEKMLQKSAGAASDLLLLNLEDGVAASQKISAREKIADALQHIRFGNRETVVRINPPEGETGRADLVAIVPLSPDGICLPKVERAEEIKAADAAIRSIEIARGRQPGDIKLHAMIESAAGVLRAAEIASASPRMASLIFGSADFAAGVCCRPEEDRLELLLALQMIVLAARSAGIDAIDAPCFDIPNLGLLARESSQARRIGFTGKSALHPNQLAVINAAFDVTPEEIAWAERIIAELDEADRRGKALSTIDGNLIDNPHRAAAERILGRKKQSGPA
ncbi:MAG TPA: CoA ester lyase [Acidobacteriota bacterium]|nr:CoA ester lyase [Acidobacteriota bacterium]